MSHFCPMYKKNLLQALGIPIEDVTHLITRPPLLSVKDQIDLTECAMILIEAKIKENPLIFSNPHFHDIIFNSTLLELLEQLALVDIANDDDLEEELSCLISTAFKTIYQVVAPRRSCRRTFIRVKPNISNMQVKINKLQSVYQPAQGTQEWYEFRWKIMSASNAWKAFGSHAIRNSLIYEKCKPINVHKYDNVNVDSPLHHGHKYEPLSVMLYEDMFQTKVGEFGCIPHSTVNYLGASPDGINIDPSSDRYGRMLEIKNIVNRPITGIPKIEYWTQMQLQMETCDLNECDFLETQFVEYKDETEFTSDGSFNRSKNDELKGILLYFSKNGKPYYEYAPIGISQDDYKSWEQSTMKRLTETDDCVWVKMIYWKLVKLSCVLVLRNKLWFSAALPVLRETWNQILDGRENGYEQYAPRGTKRTAVNNVATGGSKNKCLIDTAAFENTNEADTSTANTSIVDSSSSVSKTIDLTSALTNESKSNPSPSDMVIDTENDNVSKNDYLLQVLSSVNEK